MNKNEIETLLGKDSTIKQVVIDNAFFLESKHCGLRPYYVEVYRPQRPTRRHLLFSAIPIDNDFCSKHPDNLNGKYEVELLVFCSCPSCHFYYSASTTINHKLPKVKE